MLSHKFVIIAALLMAFLVISPYWIFPLVLGTSYHGINLGEWDDDAAYISKGREILEGHSLGNTFLKVGKDSVADPHQTYVEYLLLAPARLLGLSDIAKDNIVSLYIFYVFAGIFVLILLIYFFILFYSGNKFLSAATALFTVGGYTLVKLSQATVTAAVHDFNIFGRPIMPLYGLIAFFIYINLLARELRLGNAKYVIWSGVSLGALFYVYPYAWTFALAMTGVLFLIYVFLRDWQQVKKIFLVSLIGIVLGAYAIFLALSFMFSEAGKQIINFATLSYNSLATISKLSLFVLILLALYAYKNKEKKDYHIFLAIILASWITLNQQVITGRDAQGIGHYFWYFTIPTSIVVGAYLAWELLWGWERSKIILQKYGNALLCLLIIAAFANTARQQYMGMLATWEIKEYAQNYRPIIDALNRDPKPGVILTSELFYGRFITVYTAHDLFWAIHALESFTPMERIKDALYVYMYLDKNSRSDFIGALRKIDGGELKGYGHYSSIYAALSSYWSGLDALQYSRGLALMNQAVIQSREKTISALSGEYKKITNGKNGIADILKKAEVNYIIWDKNKNPEWDLSPVPGLKEITESNNIYLYSFNY